MMDEKEQRAAWLKSLQAGQHVAMLTTHHGYELLKIERLTATLFILKTPSGHELRASRDHGYFLGRSRYERIVPVTLQVKESRELAKLQSWLSALSYHNTPVKPTLAQLRAMKRAHDKVAYKQGVEDALNKGVTIQ